MQTPLTPHFALYLVGIQVSDESQEMSAISLAASRASGVVLLEAARGICLRDGR